MDWRPVLGIPTAIIVNVPAQATQYFTVEQVQQALFPGETMTRVPVHLTAEQAQTIERTSGMRVRNRDPVVWRAAQGGWLLVDEVLGKHDDITYAVALDASGSVRALEIMEYRESYGFEIRDEAWRQQFVGKTKAAPFKLDADVKNIGGATLSCRHVADGVRRLLAMHDVALR